MPEIIRTSRNKPTHLMGMKLSNPSLPINGVDEVDVYVRWNAPVEGRRPRVDGLSSNEPRVGVMAATTDTAAAWRAQPAVATSTPNEHKRRCWLEIVIVNICTQVQYYEGTTRPGHPPGLQSRHIICFNMAHHWQRIVYLAFDVLLCTMVISKS